MRRRRWERENIFILFMSFWWTEYFSAAAEEKTALNIDRFPPTLSLPSQQSLPCAITYLRCTMSRRACGTPPTISSTSQMRPASSCTFAWGENSITVDALVFSYVMDFPPKNSFSDWHKCRIWCVVLRRPVLLFEKNNNYFIIIFYLKCLQSNVSDCSDCIW